MNFKGCKDRTISFADKTTSICGQNASGKTTIFDAFTWVLFGKDSTGRSDFDIRPLDEQGNLIHNIDVCVEMAFTHYGDDYVFKKIQKEN